MRLSSFTPRRPIWSAFIASNLIAIGQFNINWMEIETWSSLFAISHILFWSAFERPPFTARSRQHLQLYVPLWRTHGYYHWKSHFQISNHYWKYIACCAMLFSAFWSQMEGQQSIVQAFCRERINTIRHKMVSGAANAYFSIYFYLYLFIYFICIFFFMANL